ncbi:MAG: hypothetical protein IJR87_13595, partial [Bacteroidaceae bacterium]|nr:hypothetical protein [Bacteroidaceae bacterium]
ALEAFFHQTIHDRRYPSVSQVSRIADGQVELALATGRGKLQRVELWEAEAETKDFRQATFRSTELALPRRRAFDVHVALPRSGYKAFFVHLYYKHPVEREPYTVSTRMFTASPTQLFDEAFQP